MNDEEREALFEIRNSVRWFGLVLSLFLCYIIYHLVL